MTLVDALGWTLVHFLWQGAAIALLLALANVLLSQATARVRHAAACAALVAMPASVSATFAVLWSTPAGSDAFAGGMLAASVPPASTAAAEALAHATTTASMGGALAVLVYAWLTGVGLLSVRAAGGWAVAVRLAVRRTQPVDLRWQERLRQLSARLSIARPVRLRESALADVPMVIGWLRPVVLLPAAAMSGLPAAQLEALLAHELAHVRRHDYVINLAQTVVETLLFYHPGVWWVGRRIRIEREHCCDDLAVEVCGDAVAYARALARLEELRQELPHFAMAASRGSLTDRIQHVIHGGNGAELHAGRVAIAVLLVLIAVGATAYASLTKGSDQEPPRPTPAETAPAAAAPDAAEPPSSAAEDAPVVSSATSTPSALPAGQAPPGGEQVETTDFIGGFAAAGYRDLTVEQLIALKVHGATPGLARRLRSEGFEPSVDDLIAVRVHGVTPELVRDAKAAGLQPTLQQAIAFRVHGVDPAAVAEMAALGYTLDADQVIAMRVHGMTPALAREVLQLGLGTPSFDQLLALRVHGADAAFAATMAQAGLQDLDIDGLVQLRVHGVTTAELQEMAALGFPITSTDDAVRLRVHGITPAFIERARGHGFANLTLDQLIKLRLTGILDTLDDDR